MWTIAVSGKKKLRIQKYPDTCGRGLSEYLCANRVRFHVWRWFKGWFPYDRRRSRIADRRKFCDRLRSYGNTLLRSPAIVIADDRRRSQKIEPCSIFCNRLRSSAIVCDRLRSCDHMETKVLRSAIEIYPIILLILTDDSTFLSHKARMFDYSNAHLL